MKWAGNLTLKMDEKEDTYSPGSIEAERYAEDAIALKLSSSDNRGIVTVRLSKEECKNLINELTQRL